MSDERDGSLDAEVEIVERSRRYNRAKHWLILASLLWSGLMSALALTTGLSSRLRDRATQVAPERLGPTMPYVALGSLLSFLTSLPLAFYEGFLLERRYGLSNQSPRSWLGDELKQLGVGLALAVPLMQGVYAIIRRYPRSWWALLSAVAVPFT